MSWLSTVAKSAPFTKFMTPDAAIPTIEAAETVGEEISRRARRVDGSFSWVRPEKRPAFELKAISPAALKELGIPEKDVDSDEFLSTFAGQNIFTGPELYPWAQNYAGYQFGQWAGQLGDGRAISLFEVPTPNGKSYEVQLKGAGLTPYSRFADGKAVLRSSIREALASEAVNALHIPTTRALALVDLPGTFAQRERRESCAIITRFAESWVRLGTFDLYHARGDRTGLRKLADYCLQHLYKGKLEEYVNNDPEPADADAKDADSFRNRYYYLFREVTMRNVDMIAKCQAYGFFNGVLNTDNTSILGLSMDYGPFAFMDTFNSGYTPNHDDGELRYGFRNSPKAIWWNCVRLGEALGELMGNGKNVDDAAFVESGTPTADRPRVATEATALIMALGETFQKTYEAKYLQHMRERLGLQTAEEGDQQELVDPLLEMLNDAELDYNHFFRKLSNTPFFNGVPVDPKEFLPKTRGFAPRLSVEKAAEAIDNWLTLYAARLEKEGNSDDKRRSAEMKKVNPNFVLKNWVLNDVIDKAGKGDWSAYKAAQTMSLTPFQDRWEGVGYEEYLGETPQEERGAVCSCSS